MAARFETTWTCDRCGGESICADRGQPSYWVRLSRAQPPNSAEPQKQGDLCLSCRQEFDAWWAAGPDRSDATISMEAAS